MPQLLAAPTSGLAALLCKAPMGNQRIGISAGQINNSVMAVTAAETVRGYTPVASSQKANGASVMTNTTNNREHNNRELTDAELLDVCGGTDNVLEAVGVRLEAAAKAASSAVSTIVKAF